MANICKNILHKNFLHKNFLTMRKIQCLEKFSELNVTYLNVYDVIESFITEDPMLNFVTFLDNEGLIQSVYMKDWGGNDLYVDYTQEYRGIVINNILE